MFTTYFEFFIREFRRLSNLNIERLLYLEVNSLRFIYNLFYLKKLNRGNYLPLALNQISRLKGEKMFYLKSCDLIRCLRSLRHMLSRGSFCKVPYGKRISVQSVTKVHLCKSKYAHAYVYVHVITQHIKRKTLKRLPFTYIRITVLYCRILCIHGKFKGAEMHRTNVICKNM